MKKLLSLSLAAAAIAAVADYQPIQVGVSEYTSAGLNTVIPAPYTSLAGSETIPVSELVKVANLPPGTMLYYYNGSTFDAWIKGTGDNAGKWVGSDVASKDGITCSPGADTVVLGPGKALWLVLADSSTPQKIYVYGKPVTTYSSTVTAGKTALIANPKSVGSTLSISGMANGDVISIIGSAGLSTYTYDSTKKQWGSKVKSGKSLPVWTEFTSFTFPAGTGIWYTSKGSSDVTITWN
jgi:hypothetical protein